MSSTSVEAVRPASLQVRQATNDDVDLIAPLFDDYRQFYKQRSDLEGTRAFIRARLQRWESVILLAMSTDATHAPALGFVQLYPSFSSVSMRRLWILNDLFVAERARRRGVARELLSATRHILGDGPPDACAPFRECAARGLDVERFWTAHLTTLFPEVRPRGHFEVRSCDAVDTQWLGVPIVVVAALAYDATAAREAAFLAAESRALLRIAGVDGLRDEAIARTSRDLFQLALAGARRLGADYIDVRDLERVEAFYDEFTGRSRSPGTISVVGERQVGGNAAFEAGERA